MSVDPNTIHFGNALMNGIYGALFLALWASERQSRHLAMWGIGHGLIALGVLGIALIERSDFAGTMLCLAVIASGVGFVWIGVRVFDGRRPASAAVAIAVSLSPLGYGVLAIGFALEPYGHAASFLGLAAVAACGAASLARGLSAERAVARRLAFAALLLYQPAYLLSALAAAGLFTLADPGLIIILSDQALRHVLAMSLLAMDGERAHRDLTALARRDPLTGALNRAGLDHHVGPKGRRRPAGHALLLADLDHFKSVNDRWGHQAGDEVLRVFVEHTREVLRKDDAVARTGGEEFTIVLTGSTLAEAEAVAERLRRLVAGRTVRWQDAEIPVTVSIGLAAMTERDGLALAVAAADAALYRAKAGGRNRVSL